MRELYSILWRLRDEWLADNRGIFDLHDDLLFALLTETNLNLLVNLVGAQTACDNCEKCQHDPEHDCGNEEHPHCQKCGHCNGRHGDYMLVGVPLPQNPGDE